LKTYFEATSWKTEVNDQEKKCKMDFNESNLLIPINNLGCLNWKTFSGRKNCKFKM